MNISKITIIGEEVKCARCGEDATCFGKFTTSHDEAARCDACCKHGEDCIPLTHKGYGTAKYAVLEVSHAAFEEIRERLEAAGYEDFFMPDGTIDLDGLALKAEPGPRAISRGRTLHGRMPTTGPIGPGRYEYGTLYPCCYGKKPIHKEFCQKRE